MSLVFLKNIQSQAVKKKYKSVKMFRLEIESAPKDLDFFVVDMSYTPIEVESEEVRYGLLRIPIRGYEASFFSSDCFNIASYESL